MSATPFPDALPVHRDGGPQWRVRAIPGDRVVIKVPGEVDIAARAPRQLSTEPPHTPYVETHDDGHRSRFRGGRRRRAGRVGGGAGATARLADLGQPRHVMSVDVEHGAL
jgi:hypothetical protein